MESRLRISITFERNEMFSIVKKPIQQICIKCLLWSMQLRGVTKTPKVLSIPKTITSKYGAQKNPFFLTHSVNQLYMGRILWAGTIVLDVSTLICSQRREHLSRV